MSLFYLSFKTFFQNVLEHWITERSSKKVLRQDGDTSGEEFVNYLEQQEKNSRTVEIVEAIGGNGQLGRLAQELACAASTFSPEKQTIYRDKDLN